MLVIRGETIMAKTEHKDLRGDYYWSQVKKHGSKYPEFNWPSVETLMNLIYTYDVVAANSARKVGAFGITRAGFSVLMILSRSQFKACKQNEISQLMLVSRANITGLVDSLVGLGLVERTNDPHDRRVNLIRITPKGEKLLKDLLPGYYKYIQDICSIFTAEDKKKFCELLKRLRDRINEIKN
jgi:MarR family 2-MHQ and catechol resistance regulon transcriptional repressor